MHLQPAGSCQSARCHRNRCQHYELAALPPPPLPLPEQVSCSRSRQVGLRRAAVLITSWWGIFVPSSPLEMAVLIRLMSLTRHLFIYAVALFGHLWTPVAGWLCLSIFCFSKLANLGARLHSVAGLSQIVPYLIVSLEEACHFWLFFAWGRQIFV